MTRGQIRGGGGRWDRKQCLRVSPMTRGKRWEPLSHECGIGPPPMVLAQGARVDHHLGGRGATAPGGRGRGSGRGAGGSEVRGMHTGRGPRKGDAEGVVVRAAKKNT